jgi:hypothetical protein
MQQRSAGFVTQWQPEHDTGLALRDAEPSSPPFHVVQRERDDVAGAQAIRRDQEKDRVVPKAGGTRSINGTQKGPNRLPW